MITAVAEQQLRIALQAPLHLSIVGTPLKYEDLSIGGQHCLENMATAARPDWLRGRNALNGLLALVDPDADSALIEFPHACLSLTHDGGLAAAVAVSGVKGVGIDYEHQRPVDMCCTRWFLAPMELPEDSTELLRLWTVKEALYKSCPANNDLVMTDFVIMDPQAWQGTACCIKQPELQFRYATIAFADGLLSVSLCNQGS